MVHQRGTQDNFVVDVQGMPSSEELTPMADFTKWATCQIQEFRSWGVSSRFYFPFQGNDGHTVPCYASLPVKDTGSIPLIVEMPGGPHLPRTLADFSRWSHPFTQDFAILNVMKRGIGQLHDGMLWDLVHATAAFVAEHPEIDRTKIVIAGHSYGGYAALQLQSMMDTYFNNTPFKPAAIMAVCPPTDLLELIEKQHYNLPGILDSNVSMAVPLGEIDVNGQVTDTARMALQQGSPVHHPNFSVPTLVVQAALDEMVPTSHVDRYVEKAGPTDLLRKITLPHSTHVPDDPTLRALLHVQRDWLIDSLQLDLAKESSADEDATLLEENITEE